MAKKKTPAKVPAKTTAESKKPQAEAPKRKRGRPKGSTQFVTKWIAVRQTQNFSRTTAPLPVPGLRRIVLECSDPNVAPQLEVLAQAVQTKHKTLINLLNKLVKEAAYPPPPEPKPKKSRYVSNGKPTAKDKFKAATKAKTKATPKAKAEPKEPTPKRARKRVTKGTAKPATPKKETVKS